MFRLIFFLAFSWASSASAQSYGGYNVYPQGSVRAIGLGGAFTALSDDVSGILFNPAGLAHGDWKYGFDGSNNPVDNTEPGLLEASNNKSTFLFYAAAARLGKNFVIGAGVSSPLNYVAETGVVNQTTFFTDTQEVEVNITNFDLLMAYKMGPFSIGVTGHYAIAKEKIRELQTTGFNPNGSAIQNTAFDVDEEKNLIYYTLGLSFRRDKWGMGLTYTPAHTYDFDENLNSQIGSNNFFRDIEVPNKIKGGLFYQVHKKLKLAVDYTYYDAPEDSILVGTGISTSFFTPGSPLKEETLGIFHAGVEYIVTSSKANEVTLRIGYYNEPARLLAFSSRSHLTAGVEARLGPVVIGVAFDNAEDFQNSSQSLSISFGNI